MQARRKIGGPVFHAERWYPGVCIHGVTECVYDPGDSTTRTCGYAFTETDKGQARVNAGDWVIWLADTEGRDLMRQVWTHEAFETHFRIIESAQSSESISDAEVRRALNLAHTPDSQSIIRLVRRLIDSKIAATRSECLTVLRNEADSLRGKVLYHPSAYLTGLTKMLLEKWSAPPSGSKEKAA